MGLPQGDPNVLNLTERWDVEEIHVLRRADSISVKVRDRLYRNDAGTSEYRWRKLTDAEADSLWASTNKLTFQAWLNNQICPNAE